MTLFRHLDVPPVSTMTFTLSEILGVQHLVEVGGGHAALRLEVGRADVHHDRHRVGAVALEDRALGAGGLRDRGDHRRHPGIEGGVDPQGGSGGKTGGGRGAGSELIAGLIARRPGHDVHDHCDDRNDHDAYEKELRGTAEGAGVPAAGGPSGPGRHTAA